MSHHYIVHGKYAQKELGLVSTTDPIFFKENFGNAELKHSMKALTPSHTDREFLFLRKFIGRPALIQEMASKLPDTYLGSHFSCLSEAKDNLKAFMTGLEKNSLKERPLMREAVRCLRERNPPFNQPLPPCHLKPGTEDTVYRNLVISCAQGGKTWQAYKQQFDQECVSRSYHPQQVRDCLELIANEKEFNHTIRSLLRTQLKLITATGTEDYETAAQLRDRIQELSIYIPEIVLKKTEP
jgi:hypothetical protein